MAGVITEIMQMLDKFRKDTMPLHLWHVLHAHNFWSNIVHQSSEFSQQTPFVVQFRFLSLCVFGERLARSAPYKHSHMSLGIVSCEFA